MLAPKFRWLMVVLVTAFVAGCSATPVPIPGAPDSGMTILQDAGSSDSSASRDGVMFPDAGVRPSGDAAMGGDTGLSDAFVGDAEAGLSDALVGDAEAGAGDAEADAGDAEAGVDDAETSDLESPQDDALSDSLLNEGDL